MTSPSVTSPEAETPYQPTESFALRMDETDPLRAQRERFHLPLDDRGRPKLYFCGNSLGLAPKSAAALVEQDLEDWARLGVEGHFDARTPWYSYHEVFRECGARLLGATPGEVVMMNSLTVNLHLMLVSFYRPTTDRYKILTDWPTFPSDLYAFKTHMRTRGIDPDDALVIARSAEGQSLLDTEAIERVLAEQGDQIALVCMNGVNFFTGQLHDLPRITQVAHDRGCMVGFDLAHAAGNVVLHLHDWNVDFACWCSYKYLNAGPGAIAGCFIHQRHGRDIDRPRYAGWWGNDPATRFEMHMQPEFIAKADADGWQLSNPPILAMAPLQASLAIFDEVGMEALARKSRRLTGYLEYLIGRNPPGWFDIITPTDPERRGCQLSILVRDRPRQRFQSLQAADVVCDFREPDVIRVAPVPLYNTFHEVWRFAQVLTGDR